MFKSELNQSIQFMMPKPRTERVLPTLGHGPRQNVVIAGGKRPPADSIETFWEYLEHCFVSLGRELWIFVQ